jgi:hypothetical protein
MMLQKSSNIFLKLLNDAFTQAFFAQLLPFWAITAAGY